jgi:cell wall-associated NlpC family hydrolase
MRIVTLILILALASGCAHLQRVPPGPAVTRDEVMQTAMAYANHPWQAGAANIFHGTDTNGVRIDTPDAAWWGPGGWYADGRTNIGLPYCWNGDSTLAEFDAGIRAGRPAGYHFKKSEHRSQSQPGPEGSTLPVGVDCSGFVSRCWQLKERRSTYDMAKVCRRLKSFDELQPGDAVNKRYDHIILFAGWVDARHEQMRVIEAGDAQKKNRPDNYERVHEDVYDRAWLAKMGFVPLRYKEIVD